MGTGSAASALHILPCPPIARPEIIVPWPPTDSLESLLDRTLAACPLPVGMGDSPGSREIPTCPEPCDGMPTNEETRGASEGGKHLRRNKEDPTAPKKHPGKIRQYILPSAAALEVKVPFLSVTPERGAEPRPILCPQRSSLPIFQSGTLVGTPAHRLQFCFRRRPRASLSRSPSPNPLWIRTFQPVSRLAGWTLLVPRNPGK